MVLPYACGAAKTNDAMNAMKEIRVFAPASVANMGCGFDIMGMTLDAVGDVLKVEAVAGDGVEDGIRIENRSAADLPEDPESAMSLRPPCGPSWRSTACPCR